MAYVFTYNTLVDAIQKEIQRNDQTFTDKIPMFITLAQTYLARLLKITGLKTYVTDNLVPAQGPIPPNTVPGVISKPNRWLNNATFNIGIQPDGETGLDTRVQILERSYEFCRMYWPNPKKSGQPKYYCDYNYDFILIVPTPDLPYPYELGYYGFPDFLDATQQSNFLAQYAPDALFYACLVEAGYFVEDERTKVWSAKRDEAISALTNEDVKRIKDAYSTRED